MSRISVTLAVVLVSTLASPTPPAMAQPGSGCEVKCAKLQPVHVLLVDRLFPPAGHRKFQKNLAEVSGIPARESNTYEKTVDSLDEIPEELDRLAAKCQRVKTLTLSFHQHKGGLLLGRGILKVLNVEEKLTGMSCAMDSEALVAMMTGGSGMGCRGEDFMQAVGRVLLPKGGRVYAAGDIFPASFHDSGPYSMGGRWQSVRIDPGPKVQGVGSFAVPPLSAKECVQEIDEARLHLARLGALYGSCWNEETSKLAAQLRGDLVLAKATQVPLAAPYQSRVGLESHKTDAAKHFYRALDHYEVHWRDLVPSTSCAVAVKAAPPAKSIGDIPEMPLPPGGVSKGY